MLYCLTTQLLTSCTIDHGTSPKNVADTLIYLNKLSKKQDLTPMPPLCHTEPVERLADLMRHGKVTLVYAARDVEHNHARVLETYLENRLS